MGKARLEGAKEHYDVVVIGSGLAGLTSANVLAGLGRRVLLLEHHYQYGGLATWFKRPHQHIFDISLHGFPVGMIKSCRRYWTKEIADNIVRINEVRFKNPQFELSTNFDKEDFSRTLVEHFGIAESVVQDFFSSLRKMNYYDDNALTVGELFEKFFPNRNDVVRFLLEPIAYANGTNLEDPAIAYGIVFSNFMSKGVYIYRGGTDDMIGKMVAELRRRGVDLYNRVKVEKIVVKEGQVKGVMAGDRFISCDAVISNSNLKGTIYSLVGQEHFTPEYLKEAKAVRLNHSSTQVYMGLKKGETLPFVGDLVFSSEENHFSSQSLLAARPISRTFSLYYPDIRPALNHCAVVSSTNARYEDWADLNDEDYKKAKAQLIEDTLLAAEKILPNLREKLDWVEAATPKTVERYTLHLNGASFGTKFEGLSVSEKMPKQVKGLYHAGSVGIIMSGWLGAMNYGVIVADKADRSLKSERVFVELAHG